MCRVKPKRRRTLCGTTAYYTTYFEPRSLNKAERRFAIDSFKHPTNSFARKTSTTMIDYAIGEFLKHHDINSFDVILGVPSSSGIVKKIINRLLDCGFKGKFFYKGFSKTRIRNVKFKRNIIDRENSPKTKVCVPKSYQNVRKLHYDKVSKASLFPTRFRRYFENFLQLKIADQNSLLGKKILVVDDTFGEGLTMCECFRILEPYSKNVLGFTVMKDMCNKK